MRLSEHQPKAIGLRESTSPADVELAIEPEPLPSITAPGPASSAFFSLLNLNTPIKIYAARRAASAPPATSFTLLFQGTIDEVQWAGPTIEVISEGPGEAAS